METILDDKITELAGGKIELPHFRMNDRRAYMIFKDGTAMVAIYNDPEHKTTFGSATLEEVFTETNMCSEEAFSEKHDKVRSHLNEINAKFFE